MSTAIFLSTAISLSPPTNPSVAAPRSITLARHDGMRSPLTHGEYATSVYIRHFLAFGNPCGDLLGPHRIHVGPHRRRLRRLHPLEHVEQHVHVELVEDAAIGRASCRERVCSPFRSRGSTFH